MKTVFVDIDGTIFQQPENPLWANTLPTILLPGVLKRFSEWNWAGYTIILTTGRKESTRELTVAQLKNAGLFYDLLIMGLDVGGERIIINDKKNGQNTCRAINVERDGGFNDVVI